VTDPAGGVRHVVGLDLGPAGEFTALAALARQVRGGRPAYAVRHLQRWGPGTPYHLIAADVARLLAAPGLGGCPLVVDRTGVGRAAADLFAPAGVGAARWVVVTAGHAVTCGDDGSVHVPKKELVSVLQVLLQARRLAVAAGLPLAGALAREMAEFRADVRPSGDESLVSWRERPHDDLVLAVALAAWEAEREEADDGLPLVLGGRAPGAPRLPF
jgi:hypothetical protein